MTIAEALRRQKPVVFCPHCGWKLVDAAIALIKSNCPECGLPGMDAVEPKPRGLA